MLANCATSTVLTATGSYKRLLDATYTKDGSFTIQFVHVQGDSFAPPSRFRVIVPYYNTGIPEAVDRDHRVAIADFVTRLAADYIRSKALDQNANGHGWSGPKGGAFGINAPGQEVCPCSNGLYASVHSKSVALIQHHPDPRPNKLHHQ